MEKRVTQKTLQSQHTRQLLRDAFSELLSEKGLEHFTVQEVCKRANVAVGTFYKHYKTKDDIINDRYGRMDEYFQENVAPQLAEGSVLDALLVFCQFYHDYTSRGSLDVGRQILKARLTGNSGAAQNRNRPLYEMLDALFARGQASGEIRSDIPAVQLSDMYMILLRGYCFYLCSHGTHAPEGQSYEEHIRLWLTAFLPVSC